MLYQRVRVVGDEQTKLDINMIINLLPVENLISSIPRKLNSVVFLLTNSIYNICTSVVYNMFRFA